MTTGSSISQHLEGLSVVAMESSVSPEMTLEQWRRRHSARARPARRRSFRVFAAARRVVPLQPRFQPPAA